MSADNKTGDSDFNSPVKSDLACNMSNDPRLPKESTIEPLIVMQPGPYPNYPHMASNLPLEPNSFTQPSNYSHPTGTAFHMNNPLSPSFSFRISNNPQSTSLNDATNSSTNRPRSTTYPSSMEFSKSEIVTSLNPSKSSVKSMEKISFISKRASYTREELLEKRRNPISQIRPKNLKFIEGVTNLSNNRPIPVNPNHPTSNDGDSCLRNRSSSLREESAFHKRNDKPNRRTKTNSITINNQQQHAESRGMNQQSDRHEYEQGEPRFNVSSVRQLQSNDKRNQGSLAMNLAPQQTRTKGSTIQKKLKEDHSLTTYSDQPSVGPVQQLKGKSDSSQRGSGYPLRRQSFRELARESSQRDRENVLESLRKMSTGNGINNPIHGAGSSSMMNSCEGSRNVSHEQSQNIAHESGVSEQISNTSLNACISKTSALGSSTITNSNPSKTSFDEETTRTRVHSLIEEYTEQYFNSSDRSVKEALKDLADFCTSNIEQQAMIVRELFINVLKAKPHARKAVGHLLDAALNEEILSTDAFLSGFKMVVEYVPDYAVDISLIWQYIGEILGAFIGAPSSNVFLLKSILQHVPNDKAKQFFQYIIRYATEFSSQAHLQKLWRSSGCSLHDILMPELIDSSLEHDYEWLNEASDADMMTQSKENLFPCADLQLVKLFNDQDTPITDPDIINYIHEHMDPNEKFYIRNIVLSYLEACLINSDPQKKIQEDIAKKRMTVLNAIIQHKPEAEIQAVYAIQNFVSKLEHPPKMALLLFDIFYNEECVGKDAFFEWLRHPDQSETEVSYGELKTDYEAAVKYFETYAIDCLHKCDDETHVKLSYNKMNLMDMLLVFKFHDYAINYGDPSLLKQNIIH
ncbi:unnamed protein product [Rotaria sp. Silwood1]|nr:unnamed protein product [Rotaria sp. Silwood1]CAF4838449.1 unnamed protein product [Rotaria sp. Silwood1]